MTRSHGRASNGPRFCRLLAAAAGLMTASTAFAEAGPGLWSAPGSRAPQVARVADARPAVSLKTADRGRGTAVTWAPLDVASLAQEDEQEAQAAGVPLRIGVHRDAPAGVIACDADGEWSRAADGDSRWTIRLDVPGAVAVRVHFARLALPDDARLLIADGAGEPVETCAGAGPSDGRPFWSLPVTGGVAWIEYQGTADAAHLPVIEIDRVSQIYRDPLTGRAVTGDEGDAAAAPQLEPCQQDVNCPTTPTTPEVDPVARDAVARIIFSKPTGTYLCSGALLDDADPNTFAGYFLTANHCLNTQASADSVVAYWFYQRGHFQDESCAGSVPSLSSLPTSSGSTWLASSSDSDFTLLRLSDDPTDGQGLAAWTTADPSGTVAGIHHPAGSHKRKSFGTLTTDSPICGSLPLSRYHYLDWNVGITEGGSSGSPLFNASWQVVGQLYGICYFPGQPTGCDDQENYNNVYGRLGATFPSIASYLNGVIPDDGYEDNDAFAEAPTLQHGTYDLRLVDFDDYFAIDVTTGQLPFTVTATFDTADMNLDLALLDENEDVLGSSTSTGLGTESISMVLPTGTYVVRAYRHDKWGGDYELRIRLPDPDFDNDGDTDQSDYGHIQRCVEGPGGPVSDPACLDTDLDNDGNIDLDDVNLFTACMSGADIAWDPACLE